jgi:hypothetical protein
LHDRGGIQHRTHDLIISSTPAKITRQRIAHFMLGGLGIFVKQRLGGYEKTGRANATLERRVFKKFLLERMQLVSLSHSLNRLDFRALGFRTEHEARADHTIIHNDTAGTTVSSEAAFLSASEPQNIAQDFQQALAWLTKKLSRFAIESRFDVYLIGHAVSFLTFSALSY